jgi:hypothetical protein
MRDVCFIPAAMIMAALPLSKASAAPICEAGYTHYTLNDLDAADTSTKLAFSGRWKPDLPCCKLYPTETGSSSLGVCVKLPSQANGAKHKVYGSKAS